MIATNIIFTQPTRHDSLSLSCYFNERLNLTFCVFYNEIMPWWQNCPVQSEVEIWKLIKIIDCHGSLGPSATPRACRGKYVGGRDLKINELSTDWLTIEYKIHLFFSFYLSIRNIDKVLSIMKPSAIQHGFVKFLSMLFDTKCVSSDQELRNKVWKSLFWK